MSVLDEVRAAAPRRSRVCLLSVALTRIDPAEAAEFRQLIYDPRYADPESPDFVSSAGLAAAVRKRGFDVSDQMVRRHRRRLCTCDQGAS